MNKKTIIATASITALVVFLLAALFFVSPFGIRFVGVLSESPVTSNMGKLLKIEEIIDNDYMGEYSSEYLMNKAIHSYVSALNDPYSAYYNVSEFKELTSELDGEYRGIGVSVASRNGEIVIKSVNPESPAEKAGLLAGDVILSVNGTAYSGPQLSQAINAIKGTPFGKTVLLKIRRGSVESDITIKIESVKQVLVSSRVLGDSIGYLRLESFGTNVSKDFGEHLDKLKKASIKGLIIDLRDNPGGTLDSAVEIADMLLPKGNIVTIKDKKGNEEIYTSAKSELNLPMCVLINEGSASASEVLSGALQDYNKAVIVGKKSFGKGVVQSVINLGDGSGLSLTIAKYYTPSGKCIHGIGIYPDIEVDLPEGAIINPFEESVDDTQLEVAIQTIKTKVK